jgi:hypothetical protein
LVAGCADPRRQGYPCRETCGCRGGCRGGGSDAHRTLEVMDNVMREGRWVSEVPHLGNATAQLWHYRIRVSLLLFATSSHTTRKLLRPQSTHSCIEISTFETFVVFSVILDFCAPILDSRFWDAKSVLRSYTPHLDKKPKPHSGVWVFLISPAHLKNSRPSSRP